jgi:hypothetical protein
MVSAQSATLAGAMEMPVLSQQQGRVETVAMR